MWPNLQFSADLVTFTEESLNGKLHFLCSVSDHFGYDNSSTDNLTEVQNSVGAEQSSLHRLNARQRSPNNPPTAKNETNNSHVTLASNIILKVMLIIVMMTMIKFQSRLK